MNRFLIYAIVLFFSISAVNVYSQDETAGITKTALDYMEGWYQGDAKRMKGSLHKKLWPKGAFRQAMATIQN